MIRRRELLLAGAGAVVAGALPAAALAGSRSGILLFDPRSPASHAIALALRQPGQALTPLAGDPMRFWRDKLARAGSSVSGVTRWSDYVVLSEAAREQRLRVRREVLHPQPGAPLLVSWTLG
jgi:hypothetical protein